MTQHYLYALFNPRSIVVAGASPREGSVGFRLVSNILDGGYTGTLWLVNARYRKMFDRSSHRSIRTLPECPDLAILVTPENTLIRMISNCADRGVHVVVAMTMSHRRQALQDHARALGVRLLGPGSAGLIRPSLSLNATYSTNRVATGKLALVSQSATLASAVIDWADSHNIGFSALVATGFEADIGMPDLLDFLSQDDSTRAIIIYLDRIRHGRTFLSAVAEAARKKPVLLLKSTQDAARFCDVRAGSGEVYSSDRVLQAALDRAGVVRIRTFSNLFAAARILSSGNRTRGSRLAVVSNGAAPAMLACARIQARGFELAALPPDIVSQLDTTMPAKWSGVNPLVVRDYENMSKVFATTVSVVLASEHFDAVLVLFVPDNWCNPHTIAEQIAQLPNPQQKPLLTCWMGEQQVKSSRIHFQAKGILSFRTPEAATDAFDFLYRHYRNQQLLLQVPAPVSSLEHVDFSTSRKTALQALARSQRVIRDGEALSFLAKLGVPVRPEHLSPSIHARDLALRVFNDPVFGPTLSLGLGGDLMTLIHDRPVQLPPLNRFLINDMLKDEHLSKYLGQFGRKQPADLEVLATVLQRVSDLVCEIPEVYEIDINPLRVDEQGATALAAVVAVQIATCRKTSTPVLPYAHLAIHPYPHRWVRHSTLKNGQAILLRPIRPEDGDGIVQLVRNMSPESRYMRYMHAVEQLPPSMIARFTKFDYDRQMAFCGLTNENELTLAGVARYTINADGASSEFALEIADKWQGLGLASQLMKMLIEHARARTLESISGEVLVRNHAMRGLMRALGFHCEPDPKSPGLLVCTLLLSTTKNHEAPVSEPV